MIFCLLSKKFVNCFAGLAGADAPMLQSSSLVTVIAGVVVGLSSSSDRSLQADKSSRLVKLSSKASHYVFVENY